MANGCNPVNNAPIDNDTILNNPNVIRCMFFLKDVLKKVYTNGIKDGQSKFDKDFDFNLLKNFHYVEDKTITQLFNQINALVIDEKMRRLKFKTANNWLKSSGYITPMKIDGYDKNVTIVTEKGKMIGLYNEEREFNNNKYVAVMYSKAAQEFIIDNIEMIYQSKNL